MDVGDGGRKQDREKKTGDDWSSLFHAFIYPSKENLQLKSRWNGGYTKHAL
jgi:hypothetical protein